MEKSSFASIVEALRTLTGRPEVVIHEIPAPQNLAPESIAFSFEVLPSSHASDSEFGSGRLVILFDDEYNDSWEGHARCILYAHAPLDPEIGVDPYLSAVAWSWLVDSLNLHEAGFTAEAGTATKIISKGFGSLSEQGTGAKIELRASWSPTVFENISSHFLATIDIVSLVAGLPPHTGTTSLDVHRHIRDNSRPS